MAAYLTIDTTAANRMMAIAAKQIPFVTALALTDLARQVQRSENAAMATLFEHPRPFTANSTQYERATKERLNAVVFIRPEVAKYLQPYESGGLHVLPGGLIPEPVDLKPDQYGQLPKGTLDRLKARPDIYIGPVTIKGRVILGVWQRLQVNRKGVQRRKRLKGGRAYEPAQGALRLLIRLGQNVPVAKRLDFEARAAKLVQANANAAFDAAWTKAMATAR